jgi:hypothetical protein
MESRSFSEARRVWDSTAQPDPNPCQLSMNLSLSMIDGSQVFQETPRSPEQDVSPAQSREAISAANTGEKVSFVGLSRLC